jgi:hypothetical protein
MARYFQYFPTITYDIQGKRFSEYNMVTNIFFRLKIIREVLENTSSYYEYLLRESDTPEILADNVYGDPEAHWIILLANNIIDPNYDWPMDSRTFQKYIIDKYGSVANAKSTYHHYEKVVQREESLTGTITETRFRINQANLTSNLANTLESVPYDHYGNLAEDQSVVTINMGNGKTVIETTSRDRITNYDYEVAENEKRRSIKLIKQEFYPQIMSEFRNLVGANKQSYIRRLK